MENAFKAKIEDLGAGRDQARERLSRTLEPARAQAPAVLLRRGACLWRLHRVFGFQWARIMCPRELLAADDPLAAWRDRMLDLNGGFARNTPVA